jgi:hypothetical protein
MHASFSLSVRSMRCSQVGPDVRRQDAAVLRYEPRVIRTKRAQKTAPFPGRAPDVLARLQLPFILLFVGQEVEHRLEAKDVAVQTKPEDDPV